MAEDTSTPDTPATPPPTTPPSPDDYQPDSINPAFAQERDLGSNTPLNMLTPAGTSDPDRGYNQPAPTPPDVQQHMGWLHHILDRVGSILGGNETIHITKDKDGTMSVTKSPSTTGEKWGRIAAAALGGAAQGLANAQGPGGLGRAAAAGTQYGLQQPQQQRQQVEQQVDFQNKQLLEKANRISLQQKIVTQALQNKALGIQMDEDEVKRAQDLNDELQNSPWHDDLGLFPDMDSAMKAAQTDPSLLAGHAQAKHRYVPEYNKDRTIKGFHAYNEDPALKDQRITSPVDVPRMRLIPDPAHPDVLKPTQDTYQAAVGTRRGDIDQAVDKFTGDFLKAQEGYAKTVHDLEEKPEKEVTNYEQAYVKASDPSLSADDRQRYKALGDELYRKAVGLKATSSTTIVNPYQAPAAGTQAASQVQTTTKSGAPILGKQWGGGDPNSSFERTARGVLSGSALLTDMPARGAKGQPSRSDFFARAQQIAEDEGIPFNPQIAKQEATFASQPKTQATLDGIDRIIGYGNTPGQFDQMIQLAKAAGLGPYAPINELTLKGQKFMGEDAAKNFQTSVTDTRRAIAGLMGNPLLGGGETDKKLTQADETLGKNPTLSNLISARKILTDSLKMQRDSIVHNNRYLQQRYGTSTPSVNQTNPNPPQQNAPRTVPPGKFAHRTNGVIDGYADDQKGTNYVPLK